MSGGEGEAIVVGAVRYLVRLRQEHSRWKAQALCPADGDPFGLECVGPTKVEAIGRLSRWLLWQSEHAAALEALQHAERAYHRAVGDRAFAGQGASAAAIVLQKVALDQMEAARARLDEARARRPSD